MPSPAANSAARSLVAPIPRLAAGARFEQLPILPSVHGDVEVHEAAAARQPKAADLHGARRQNDL